MINKFYILIGRRAFRRGNFHAFIDGVLGHGGVGAEREHDIKFFGDARNLVKKRFEH